MIEYLNRKGAKLPTDKNLVYVFGWYEGWDNLERAKGDAFHYVFKDPKSHKKYYYKEDRPEIPYYILKGKDGKPIPFKDEEKLPVREFAYRDELLIRKCSYKYRESALYEAHCDFKRGEYYQKVKEKLLVRGEINLDKRIFMGDTDLESQRLRFYLDKDTENDMIDFTCITNGYIDIENDIHYDEHGDDPSHSPIYMMSYTDDVSNTVYLNWLKDSRYPNQEELLLDEVNWIKKVKLNIISELKENTVLNKETIDLYIKRTIDSKIIIKSYEKEDENLLIRDTWALAFDEHQPDFLQAFNAQHDVHHSRMRLNFLEKDDSAYKDLFTSKKLRKKNNSNRIVRHNYKEVRVMNGRETKNDAKFDVTKKAQSFNSVALTKIIDIQAVMYSLTGERADSFSLDDTCRRKVGITKVDFSDEASTMTELPHKNFARTAEYNIRDTYIMSILNHVKKDMYTACIMRPFVRSEFDKMFGSMHGVMNTFEHLAQRGNMIYASNRNAVLNKIGNKMSRDEIDMLEEFSRELFHTLHNIKDNLSIKGGLCLTPNNVSKVSDPIIKGVPNSRVFTSVIDGDMKSWYPLTAVTGNFGITSLIGRIIDSGLETEMEIKELIMAIFNANLSSIGKWFNLPSAEEIASEAVGDKIKYDLRTAPKIMYYSEESSPIISKVLGNMFRNKVDKIDMPKSIKKNTPEYHVKFHELEVDEEAVSLTGSYLLTSKDSAIHKYMGSLVEYGITDSNIKESINKYIEQDTYVQRSSGKLMTKPLFETHKSLNRKNRQVNGVTPKLVWDTYVPVLNGTLNLNNLPTADENLDEESGEALSKDIANRFTIGEYKFKIHPTQLASLDLTNVEYKICNVRPVDDYELFYFCTKQIKMVGDKEVFLYQLMELINY